MLSVPGLGKSQGFKRRAFRTDVLLAGHICPWIFLKVLTWRVRGASLFFTDKGSGVGLGNLLVSTLEALAWMWICLFVPPHVSSRT